MNSKNIERKVEIYRMHPNAVFPEKKTQGSAGMDLHCCIKSEDNIVVLSKNEFYKFGTGIGIVLPQYWEAQVRSRSGLASKGVALLGGVGTIDSDYRGEIFVTLINHSESSIVIRDGDRIAQLVINALPEFVEVYKTGEPPQDTERGKGGFGSTGI